MNTTVFFIYLAIMAGSTYLIRAIPFAAVKRKIENRYIRSFLSYIPYAVLTAMTLPACLYATDSVISGTAGLVTAVIFARKGKSLTVVAAAACIAVFVVECIMKSVG